MQHRVAATTKDPGTQNTFATFISSSLSHPLTLSLTLSLHSNPNEHHRQDSVLPVSKERNRFRSITWENYDPLHQKYLEIGKAVKLFVLL